MMNFNFFCLKLLKNFSDGASMRECWRVASDVEPMIKGRTIDRQISNFWTLFCFGIMVSRKKHIEIIMYSKSCVRFYGKNAHHLCSWTRYFLLL